MSSNWACVVLVAFLVDILGQNQKFIVHVTIYICIKTVIIDGDCVPAKSACRLFAECGSWQARISLFDFSIMLKHILGVSVAILNTRIGPLPRGNGKNCLRKPCFQM